MARGQVLLGLWWKLFFGYVEPVSALLGAYYAHTEQHAYLSMTSPLSLVREVSLSTSVVLSQLANLYLLFAFNEALVLRSTSDTRVWRTFLLGLLVADVGHLYSLRQLGASIYWDTSRWNAIHLGNVPFVYIGALTRITYLLWPQRVVL